MTKPANKSPSQRGRKSEGRTAKMIRMRPEAWAMLDARLRERSDTRGRVIERMLANPALPPETETKHENKMQDMTTIDTTGFFIRLGDPLARRGGEPEPWVAAANARVQAAAERIGLEVVDWDESRPDDDFDDVEIEWGWHAGEKGIRYNTRQWEMWLRRRVVGWNENHK